MRSAVSASGMQEGKMSRVDEVREELLQMAVARGPGIKLPTVRELCAQFDVPFRTLEHAILQLEQRQLLVRRQGSGIYATDRVRQQSIGVVFGGDIFQPMFSPFWSLLLDAVRGQAGESNLLPRAYFDIEDGHRQLVEDLEARRLEGLLLFAPRFEYDEASELRAHGVPLVCFGGNAESDWSVTLDWDRYFELAAADLAGAGVRRIGFLAAPSQRPVLEHALGRAGGADIEIADWSFETWAGTVRCAGTRESCAYSLTQQMIAGRAAAPLPDALLCTDDTAARGAITALLAAGLQPGRDIRIVTAENKGSPVLEPWAADLRRIVFGPEECATAALAMLETLMDGGTSPQNPALITPRIAENGAT